MLILIALLLPVTFADYYKYLSYKDILDGFQKLQQDNPLLVTLQDPFSDTNETNIPLCGQESCKYFYAVLSNPNSTQSLPTILITGGIYGNSRLGPNIVTYLAQTLLLGQLRNLLNYRKIILMPLVNPGGYFNVQNNETQKDGSSYDIRQDFNKHTESQCFQSYGAQALKYVYSQNIILSTLSFYSGDSAIAYPWGFTASTESPPDMMIFEWFADIIRYAGGQNHNLAIEPYKVGQINSFETQQIPSLEDWSYYLVQKANFSSAEKCYKANTSSLSFMVRTDRALEPPSIALGLQQMTSQLLRSWPPTYYQNSSSSQSQDGFGHINRNIMLSLALIDLIQPYIIWDSYLNDTLKWRLGGCLQVDSIEVRDDNGELIKLSNQSGIWQDKQFEFSLQLTNATNSSNYHLFYSCDQDLYKGNQSAISIQALLRGDKNYSFEGVEDSFKTQSLFNHSFSLQEIQNLVAVNQSSLDQYIKVHTHRSSLYIWILVALFLLLGLLLSFVFYKYCQKDDNEEHVEMVGPNIIEEF